MDEKKIYLTEEGLNELKKELDFLKLEKRPEIINAVRNTEIGENHGTPLVAYTTRSARPARVPFKDAYPKNQLVTTRINMILVGQ